MLSKRIFWLICAVVVSWLIWMRLRQRQEEFVASTPQFAPPRTFAPTTPAAPLAPPTPLPASNEASTAVLPALDEASAAAPIPTPSIAEEASTAVLPVLDEASAAAPIPTPSVAEEASTAVLPALDEASAAAPIPAPSVADAAPDSANGTADLAQAVGGAEVEISGYCMRCKTKRPIQDAQRETTESGRPAARGTCPVCGANMFTFLATDDDT
jgi:hypothetical protein